MGKEGIREEKYWENEKKKKKRERMIEWEKTFFFFLDTPYNRFHNMNSDYSSSRWVNGVYK